MSEQNFDRWALATRAIRVGHQRTPEGEHGEPIFPTSSFVFASAAEAARRSPCDPVTISIRFSRGSVTASSGLTVAGKSSRTFSSTEASIIRRIARPSTQIDRPAATAASAYCSDGISSHVGAVYHAASCGTPCRR